MLLELFANQGSELSTVIELFVVMVVGPADEAEVWLRPGPPEGFFGLICIDYPGRCGLFSTATATTSRRDWILGPGCGVGPVRGLPSYVPVRPRNLSQRSVRTTGEWPYWLPRERCSPDLSFLKPRSNECQAWEAKWGEGFLRAVAAIAAGDREPAFHAECPNSQGPVDLLYPMTTCSFCTRPIPRGAYQLLRDLDVPAGWYFDPFKENPDEKPKRQWDGRGNGPARSHRVKLRRRGDIDVTLAS